MPKRHLAVAYCEHVKPVVELVHAQETRVPTIKIPFLHEQKVVSADNYSDLLLTVQVMVRDV